ncbi:MAG TPA: Minf_1886 family protein [Candidatus Eisenbacteria bacterium]|jgi:uncharacterized repeat protein (TIGR04138 family)
MSGAEMGFWETVDEIRARDGRYRREAYGFVMAALGATVQALPEQRRSDPATRHLSGQELLQGVIGLARREFGRFAETVFREWGVASGEDIGRMVFQLVEAKQLSARREDTIDDFGRGGDLFAALTENLDFGPARTAEDPPDRLSRREPGSAA